MRRWLKWSLHKWRTGHGINEVRYQRAGGRIVQFCRCMGCYAIVWEE